MSEKKLGVGGAKDPQELTVGIVMDADEDLDPIYVNHAEISQSQFECEMNLTRIPAKLSAEQIEAIQEDGPLRVSPLVKIIFPKAMLPGLVQALTVQMEKAKTGGTE